MEAEILNSQNECNAPNRDVELVVICTAGNTRRCIGRKKLKFHRTPDPLYVDCTTEVKGLAKGPERALTSGIMPRTAVGPWLRLC